MDFSILKGKTLTKCETVGDEQIRFETIEGDTFVLCHFQDCCEHVSIESINGDLNDLVGYPLLLAEESSSEEDTRCDSWTFYRLATIKGYVDIRWYGSSNGYYSMAVSFCKE